MWGRYALPPLNVSSPETDNGSKTRVSDVKRRLPSGVPHAVHEALELLNLAKLQPIASPQKGAGRLGARNRVSFV
jgi:hypothetical protein